MRESVLLPNVSGRVAIFMGEQGKGLGVRSWEQGGQGGRWHAGLHLGSSQTHVKHENNQIHQ